MPVRACRFANTLQLKRVSLCTALLVQGLVIVTLIELAAQESILRQCFLLKALVARDYRSPTRLLPVKLVPVSLLLSGLLLASSLGRFPTGIPTL
jgi:hypothetical protein